MDVRKSLGYGVGKFAKWSLWKNQSGFREDERRENEPMFIEEVIQMTERKMREAAASDPENPALKSLREDVGSIEISPQGQVHSAESARLRPAAVVASITPATHFPAASNSAMNDRPSKRKRRISHKIKTKPRPRVPLEA